VAQAVTTLDALASFYGFNLSTISSSPFTIPNSDRLSLAAFFGRVGFTNGAEIGVESGRYAQALCHAIPKLHLYCVDPWLQYGDYRSHVPQERVDRTPPRLRLYDHPQVQRRSGSNGP
jgi:hypothetical protein